MHSRCRLTLTPGGHPGEARSPERHMPVYYLGDITCGLTSYVALSTGVACNLSTVCQSTYFA